MPKLPLWFSTTTEWSSLNQTKRKMWKMRKITSKEQTSTFSLCYSSLTLLRMSYHLWMSIIYNLCFLLLSFDNSQVFSAINYYTCNCSHLILLFPYPGSPWPVGHKDISLSSITKVLWRWEGELVSLSNHPFSVHAGWHSRKCRTKESSSTKKKIKK